MMDAAVNMQQKWLNVLTIISIAIIIGGIVFIFLGTVLFVGAANFSDSFIQDSFSNKTSGGKSVIGKTVAKTVTSSLAPIFDTLTQITKGTITSIASFLCLVGAGICVLGYCLFKAKYFAWVLTLILMFVAIVIDVLGLGFVGGALTNDSAEFAYVLIAVMIIHLIANSGIIYYLTRKLQFRYLELLKFDLHRMHMEKRTKPGVIIIVLIYAGIFIVTLGLGADVHGQENTYSCPKRDSNYAE